MPTTDGPDADLTDTDVAILIAPEGTEEVEFTEPRDALADAGADVDVLSTEDGEAETVNDDLEDGDRYAVDRTIDDASPEDYDGLVIPGGTVGADTLRGEDEVAEFVAEHDAAGDPIGSICHGPWTLVEAGAVADRIVTSYPSLETDVENAGGAWVDEEVVVDDGLVTSRDPDDLDAFCEAVVETFAAA